jgi:hypothetical protein
MKYYPSSSRTTFLWVRQLDARSTGAHYRDSCFKLIFAGTLLLTALASSGLILHAQALSGQLSAASRSVELIDPNKIPSELNHHIAGYFLIAIGVMVICGRKYERLRFLQRLWPLLFIGAGLFLAAWSDDEIWPRGDLSWLWLIAHDAEARQHKIYALLLLAIGLVEYLRAHGRLSRRWATWLFPCLAVFGGVLLFFHDHGGHGTHGPVMPSLTPAAMDEGHSGALHPAAMYRHISADSGSLPRMNMHEHRHQPDLNTPSRSSASNELQQGPESPSDGIHPHNHVMTGAMLKIEQQHMWFAILGFCIALLKYLDDRRPFGQVSRYPWAHCMIALGVLLVLYAE